MMLIVIPWLVHGIQKIIKIQIKKLNLSHFGLDPVDKPRDDIDP
ncbi:MAG: palindromic element RPE4 domain-containing protein [Janthinobacterium lividum]